MFWKSGLVEAIKDTENIIDTSDDNSLVVIKDKYPKVLWHSKAELLFISLSKQF